MKRLYNIPVRTLEWSLCYGKIIIQYFGMIVLHQKDYLTECMTQLRKTCHIYNNFEKKKSLCKS